MKSADKQYMFCEMSLIYIAYECFYNFFSRKYTILITAIVQYCLKSTSLSSYSTCWVEIICMRHYKDSFCWLFSIRRLFIFHVIVCSHTLHHLSDCNGFHLSSSTTLSKFLHQCGVIDLYESGLTDLTDLSDDESFSKEEDQMFACHIKSQRHYYSCS